ncbi:hypothetical protein Pcinc_012158 [Petrolisthes cinctipes]|uniref:Uncharacterized protein n=1 Tax=Petrolisthes cinctipes TaxID=88211 RepID=A0AAE1G5E4_PETCI|nr:hypothetical protein Pcinc_012158 [Petrolisthes cinctipes]
MSPLLSCLRTTVCPLITLLHLPRYNTHAPPRLSYPRTTTRLLTTRPRLPRYETLSTNATMRLVPSHHHTPRHTATPASQRYTRATNVTMPLHTRMTSQRHTTPLLAPLTTSQPPTSPPSLALSCGWKTLCRATTTSSTQDPK